MNKKEKVLYIQGIRAFACIVILIGHYLSIYMYDVSVFLSSDKCRFFMAPFKGSSAVVIFCVIGGFFAYRNLKDSDISMGKVALKRYMHFLLPVLTANILYFFVTKYLGSEGVSASVYRYNTAFALKKYIGSGILLEDTIIPAFWVLQELFWGPVFIALILKFCKQKAQRFAVLSAAFLCLIGIGKEYIALSILGVLLFEIMENVRLDKIKKSAILNIIFLFVGWLLFTIPENYENKLFSLAYGLGAMLMIYAISNLSVIRKLLSTKSIVAIGDSSFELYCFHLLIVFTLPLFIKNYCLNNKINYSLEIQIISLLLVLTISILLSLVSHKLFAMLLSVFEKQSSRIKELESLIVINFKKWLKIDCIESYNPTYFWIGLIVLLAFVNIYVFNSSSQTQGYLGTYSMDYLVHTGISERIFQGKLNETNEYFRIAYTYPLYHITTKILSKLLGLTVQATSGFTIMIYVGATVLINRFLFSYKNLQAKKQYIIDFFSVASVLVICVLIPQVVNAAYFPQGGPNLWHNPTYLVARPFAIISTVLFVLSFEKRTENYKKYLVWFGIVMFICDFAKPSFAIVMLPIAALFVIYAFIISKGKTFKYSIGCLLAVLPTVALGIYQMLWSKIESRAAVPLTTAKFEFNLAFLYLLLMVLFPLFVFCVKGYKKIKSPMYIMLWSMVLLGWLEYYHTVLGDFIWGYEIAGHILMAYSTYLLFIEDSETSKSSKIIGGSIFAIQLIMGIFYFITGVLGSHLFY